MELRTLALSGCLALAATSLCGADEVQVSHLYELSDFNGTIPYSDVILHADRRHDEVYAVVGNNVRVFNRSGMEFYRFQHDPVESSILDLLVDERGDIVTLNLDLQSGSGARDWWIQRCDYRGEPTDRIVVTGLPEEIADFVPNRFFRRGGEFVLVNTNGMQVVNVDDLGQFRERQDLAELLELEKPESMELTGFSFDRAGNMLFTIAVQFRAYVVTPDGKVRMFGTPGSAPGKFGIAAGIVGTDDGHYVVADKLRRVVMVFDSNFQLVTEFAGTNRWSLARPTHLALGNDGKLFVTQSQNRGVAVLGLSSGASVRASDLNSSVNRYSGQKTGL